MTKLIQEHLDTSAGLLRAIAHPLRLKILKFIDRNNTINVNKIYNELNLEQSITSQHLRILRKADLVTTRREGKYVLYSLDYTKIAKLNSQVLNFLELDGNKSKSKKTL